MKKNHFISGEWNLICDVCSKKIKAHEARQRWDGFIVCPDDFENRHPQDFVKANTDKLTVPFVRPRPIDIFVDDGNRSPIDNIILTDSILRLINRSVNEELVIDDAGQDYVDVTYFLEDYIIGTGLRIDVTKVITESIGLTDSGEINTQDYIDSTYFAQDYLGTTISF